MIKSKGKVLGSVSAPKETIVQGSRTGKIDKEGWRIIGAQFCAAAKQMLALNHRHNR